MSLPAPVSRSPRAVRAALVLLLAGATLLFGGCVPELAAGESVDASGRPVPNGGPGTPSPLATSRDHTGSTTADPFEVEGYLLIEPDSARHVVANAALTTMIGVDGVMVADDGASILPEPEGAREVVAEAHARGMKAELLIANYDLETKDFSAAIGSALLGSPANRTAVIGQLVATVQAGGYDSVQLDLEYLGIADAAGLTAFALELDSALAQLPDPEAGRLDAGARSAADDTDTDGFPLSIAVMAKPSPAEYLAAGYDFAGLLATVDRVVLMGYDQHGPSWSEPGPVGGLPWVRTSLDALRASGVPSGTIDLGIGAYGYSWPGDGSPGTTLRVTDARAIAGDRAEFDTEQGEWTATLDDKTVLWWSDEASRDLRMQFAKDHGLHGVAIWQLASAE